MFDAQFAWITVDRRLRWQSFCSRSGMVRPSTAAESVAKAAAAKPPKASPAELDSTDARIDELIQQLGSPQFAVRRAAANEIRKIGPEAFDQLHAATDDSDPEIAANANYLLRQIDVRWTRSDDSATVRTTDDSVRRSRRHGPAACHPDAGRSARARRHGRTVPDRAIRPVAAAVAARGAGDRAGGRRLGRPAELLQAARSGGLRPRVGREHPRGGALAATVPDSAARSGGVSVAGWQRLIDEEAQRLDTDADETSPDFVSALLWNLADVHRRLGETGPLVATTDRLLALGGAG